MKNQSKKILAVILLVVILILGGASIFIATRISTAKPVAPTAPESKPKASVSCTGSGGVCEAGTTCGTGKEIIAGTDCTAGEVCCMPLWVTSSACKISNIVIENPPRPEYCDTAKPMTISSATITTGNTVTVTLNSNTDADMFSLYTKNIDNGGKHVCVGTEAASTNCPNGGHPLVFTATDTTTLRKTGTINLTYEQIFVTDKSTGNKLSKAKLDGYIKIGNGQYSVYNAACSEDLAIAQDYCATATPMSFSKNSMVPGESTIVTLTSNTNVNKFKVGLLNKNNTNKPVCVGTEAASATCPNGGHELWFTATDTTTLRKTGTINLTYEQIFVTDKSTGLKVTSALMNGYFSIDNGPESIYKAECSGTVSSKVAPMCTDLVSQTVETASGTPGYKTLVTCDFGKEADCIGVSTGAEGWASCVYKSSSGTEYTYECTAPTRLGTFISKCNLRTTSFCTAAPTTCSQEGVQITVTAAPTPDLSVTKKAYKDNSNNVAGTYNLTEEITTVSKNQIFVYAFDIENAGNGIASGAVITDTLTGEGQDQLSFVDSSSKCAWNSGTKTVTCTVDVQPESNTVVAFRVKTTDSIANGTSIKNVVKVTNNSRETTSEKSLTVSSIVGCNHTCTTDGECESGFTCDTTSKKCRKPACTSVISCVCPVTTTPTKEITATPTPTRRVTAAPTDEVTEAPTEAATATPTRVAATTAPSTLPETGIFDMPGVAAFGGGLILAIVGLLLAL